jgi:hypothetical protein
MQSFGLGRLLDVDADEMQQQMLVVWEMGTRMNKKV